MTARFINIDRETPLLFPPDLRDWVPENDLSRFIIDCLNTLPIENYRINNKGTGSEQYPPKMMLALLIYCYSQGIFTSRKIEAATWRDISARFIAGGNQHPDHSTISDFRKKNKLLFRQTFVKVLEMAVEMKLLKIGKISLDGTKIKANASKHKAVSYQRADDTIKKLTRQVRQLEKQAKEEEDKNEGDGVSIPDEIKRREVRIKKLKEAKEKIEKRHQDELKARQEKQRKEGKCPRNNFEESKPDAKKQINFTDEESRIMKAGNGKHFQQSYNAQCAVDTDGSMLIVGTYVTNRCNDKEELIRGVESVPAELGTIDKVAADNGYYSEEQIKELERKTKTTAYVAMGRKKHGKTIGDLKKDKKRKPEKVIDLSKGDFRKKLRQRMDSKEGFNFYKIRKQTVEPVFGVIKNVIGFKEFLLRGVESVNTEWDLVCIAYNFKKIHNLALQSK